ncbi:MAG: DUF5678 domain-containing protein [Nitrospira sp.]|nr:DUF5678 domain-containing protein [Nitrospira sp.]
MPELLTKSGNTAIKLMEIQTAPWSQDMSIFASPRIQYLTYPAPPERPAEFLTTLLGRDGVKPRKIAPPCDFAENNVSQLQAFEQSSIKSQNIALLREINQLLSEGELPKAYRLLGEAIISGMRLSEPLKRLQDILSNQSVVSCETTTPVRTDEAAWVKANWNAYKGKWVAVLGDEAIASGDTFKEVLATVKELRPTQPPIIHHIK